MRVFQGLKPLSCNEDFHRHDSQSHCSLDVFDDLDPAFNAAVRYFAAERLGKARRAAANGRLNGIEQRVQFGGWVAS